MTSQFLATLSNGLVVFAVFTLSVSIIWPLYEFIALHLRPGSLPRYKHATNPWALVTGASDGIGFGFVNELASQGFNVILHGRNPVKLDGLIDKLRKEYSSSQFRKLVVSASDRSAWHQLDTFADSLIKEKLSLTLLVNNVGGAPGGQLYNNFNELSQDDINGWVDVNATFPTQITRSLLPVLKLNQPAGVLTIGSAAAFVASPYLGVYCGGKAFDFTWSNSLRIEMMAENVDIEILAINLAKVQTAASNMVKESFFIPTSRQMARAAIQKLGCGLPYVTGYWPHALQLFIVPYLPQSLRDNVSISITRKEMELQSKAS